MTNPYWGAIITAIVLLGIILFIGSIWIFCRTSRTSEADPISDLADELERNQMPPPAVPEINPFTPVPRPEKTRRKSASSPTTRTDEIRESIYKLFRKTPEHSDTLPQPALEGAAELPADSLPPPPHEMPAEVPPIRQPSSASTREPLEGYYSPNEERRPNPHITFGQRSVVNLSPEFDPLMRIPPEPPELESDGGRHRRDRSDSQPRPVVPILYR